MAYYFLIQKYKKGHTKLNYNKMKVYTKTGDKGMTSLVGGKRVAKNSIRLEAYGTIDELNSYLGLLRSYSIVDINQTTDVDKLNNGKLNNGKLNNCELNKDAFTKEIVEIQSRLFDLGSYLATETNEQAKLTLTETDIENIEKSIDIMEESLPPMKFFIVPGGTPLISYTHIARTVCRRAERRIIDLAEQVEQSNEIGQIKLDPLAIAYVNRLSDYLFVLSRYFAFISGAVEEKWIPRK